MPAVRLVLNKTFLASLPSNPAVSCRSVNTWVNILAVLFPPAADFLDLPGMPAAICWPKVKVTLTSEPSQAHQADAWGVPTETFVTLRSKIHLDLRMKRLDDRLQYSPLYKNSNPAWSALHVPHWTPNCSSLHHQLFAFFFFFLPIEHNFWNYVIVVALKESRHKVRNSVDDFWHSHDMLHINSIYNTCMKSCNFPGMYRCSDDTKCSSARRHLPFAFQHKYCQKSSPTHS